MRGRLREIGAILLGLVSLLGLIAFLQWQLPKGQPVRVEGKIVTFESRFVKGFLRNVVFANIRLPDGKIMALALPNDGRECARGDVLWLDRYDNRYQLADMRCHKP